MLVPGEPAGSSLLKERLREMSETQKEDSEVRRRKRRPEQRGPRIKMPSLESLVESRSAEIRRCQPSVVADPFEMLRFVIKESCRSDPTQT